MSSTLCPPRRPALLTRMSTPPYAPRARPTMASTCDSSVVSQTMPTASPPRFVIHAAHCRALSADAVSGRGKVRVIVNDAVEAKRALRRAKYLFIEEPAFVVRLRNKPGSLARVAGKLAKEKVNIKSAYATTAGRGGATVVFTVGSTKKARKVLR